MGQAVAALADPAMRSRLLNLERFREIADRLVNRQATLCSTANTGPPTEAMGQNR
jgi:hypothetical protein